jgi:F-box associated protein
MQNLPPELLQCVCDHLDSISFFRLRACSQLLRGARQSPLIQSITTRIIQFRKTYSHICYLWELVHTLNDFTRLPGSTGHCFRNPIPLSSYEVECLESTVGRLPDEYRRFIQECGAPSSSGQKDNSYIICGCPGYGLFREPIIFDPKRVILLFDFDEANQHFSGIRSGTIEITTKGCAHATLLSLRGPFSGQVFNVDFDLCQVTLENTSFLDWILSWAETVADVLSETTISSDEDFPD